MKLTGIITAAVALALPFTATAQVDRHNVRSGNRAFSGGNYRKADVQYRKALLKDSTSFAANYNAANTAYRLAGGQDAQGGLEEAGKFYKAVEGQAALSHHESQYWFNVGDAALASKDYKGAVDAFKKSLLVNPGDMDAKENYLYAKKKLEDQQNQQNQDQNNQDQQNNDQNQNNQNQQDNQDQNQDQNKDRNQDNQDQQNDQNQDNQQDQNRQQPQDGEGQPQPQQGEMTPQQAQQMLQAIQAKEKETQDKVDKKKQAIAASAVQPDKNW